MQLLILPRGTNAEELFSAGAKLDDKGKLTFSGFQTTEIPFSTSLLVHDKGDKYTQHTLATVLTLFSGDKMAQDSLPNCKNSLPTSRRSSWITSYLSKTQNQGQPAPKQEKHTHSRKVDKESKKKHKAKASSSVSEPTSSHKEDKHHTSEDVNDRKIKKVKS